MCIRDSFYGDRTEGFLKEINEWAYGKGVSLYLLIPPPEGYPGITAGESISDLLDIIGELDYVVSIGGDGTLLHAAHIIAPYNIPILGINQGRLGFLTDLQDTPISPSLDRLISGDIRVSKRRVLYLKHIRESGTEESIALNDVTITRDKGLNVVSLQLYINNEFVSSFYGDGVIVSTPTGSTGYSLSAGGPVITPDANVNIITPICPHTLRIRPLVVNASDTIWIKSSCHRSSLMLNVDGLKATGFDMQDVAEITTHPRYLINLVHINDMSFFSILSRKLEWGG